MDLSLEDRASSCWAPCFVDVCFLLYFGWMVPREVDGQHVFLSICSSFLFDRWSVFKSTGLLGWSWAAPRASVGGPVPLSGPIPGPLSGPLWAVLGRLGAFVGGPGPSWVCSWVLCWRSGGLCWRSWAALGTSVGGPGQSWFALWPKRKQEDYSESGQRPGRNCGPNPSRKAILGQRGTPENAENLENPEAQNGVFFL